MIPLKSEKDLRMMRASGKILNGIIKQLIDFIKPGISTSQINDFAQDLAGREKAIPAFKGYKGFPAAICTSVNEEIVHGIPGPRVIKEGDIIGLDFGINYDGYFTDSAVTLAIGRISPPLKKLIEITRASLYEGIRHAKAGNRLSDISSNIQNYVERNGFSVVRQFVGHGIGLSLHEEPEVPNFGRPHEGPVLECGMVFAIEPMVNMGTWEAEFSSNGWTAVTKDRLPSAHFEHTVAITEKGPEVLT